MKKGGEGPHNWGGADSELRDEIDAQEDARRDAEEARADGDEHPVGQTFDERAKAGTSLDVGSTGTLAEEFADKEGSRLARTQLDPNSLDLKEIARTSGGVSHPTGDAVSSGADSGIEASADAIGRSKGTEGGFGGNLGSGEQEIIRDATTSNIP